MLWWSNRAYIRHLEAEIHWLHEQMLLERRRAEDAINALLLQRQPMALTTTAPPMSRAEMDVEHLMRDTEFTSAGNLDG